MKKIISLVSVAIMLLSLSITASAGSVPEDLLSSDDALVFFGEVVLYSEDSSLEVKPVLKIKGDVELESKLIYNNYSKCGDFEIEEERVYIFTYFDENNPSYIFKTSSYDVKALTLSGTETDMWKRFEEMLNSGEFTDAENARINRRNESLTKTGDKISIKELMGLNPETIQTVHLIINDNEKHEINKDEFLTLAEEIVVTDIENTNIDTEDGMYILINNDYYTPLFISKGCKVEKHSPKFSRPPYADYTMNAEDMNKLYSLLPENAGNFLPPLEDSSNAGLYTGVGVALIVVLAVVIVCVIRKKKKVEEN